jgi:peptidyl-prolyl cis-trans isomerase B (cyclophilin B)
MTRPRPRPRSLAVVSALATIALALALGAPVAAQDDPAPQPPAATPNPVPLDAPAGDGTAVRLKTDLGDVVIGLFTESAPVAAENFLNLARSGFYDGVGFHRVVPGFVVQGGDPEGTGRGGPGYTIRDEEVVGQYGRGIVAMARTPAPDSQGSQFFFVLDDSARASLDAARTYVIFGRVVEGMDVVDAIVERGPASDRIEEPVRIISASIEQVELPAEPTSPPPTLAELAADALAARIPDRIAGVDIDERASFDSSQLLAQMPVEVLDTLTTAAGANGTDLETLALAQGGGESGEAFVTLVAASIAGVPGEEVLAPLADLVLVLGDEAVLREETIGGRLVTRIETSAGAGPDGVVYAITSGDVVWFFIADEGSLEDVVSSIP